MQDISLTRARLKKIKRALSKKMLSARMLEIETLIRRDVITWLLAEIDKHGVLYCIPKQKCEVTGKSVKFWTMNAKMFQTRFRELGLGNQLWLFEFEDE